MVAATILMEQKAEVDVVGSPTVPADGPLGPRLVCFADSPQGALFGGHCDSTATCLALSGEAHVVPQ
jgi:hypothetical protein